MTPATKPDFANYDAFWLHYLAQHRRPGTRQLHYLGSSFGLLGLGAAALARDWRLAAASPIVGYGCAWLGHLAIEGNRPATFGHPVWSLISDFRMLGLALSGGLARQLDRVPGQAGGAGLTRNPGPA